MLNSDQFRRDDFSRLISFARTVLNSSEQTIKNSFSDNKILPVDYGSSDEITDNLLEIRLDMATLTCRINNVDICYASYLVPDNPDASNRCLEYCRNVYSYNCLMNVWSLPDCYLLVERSEINTIFIFLSMCRNGRILLSKRLDPHEKKELIYPNKRIGLFF